MTTKAKNLGEFKKILGEKVNDLSESLGTDSFKKDLFKNIVKTPEYQELKKANSDTNIPGESQQETGEVRQDVVELPKPTELLFPRNSDFALYIIKAIGIQPLLDISQSDQFKKFMGEHPKWKDWTSKGIAPTFEELQPYILDEYPSSDYIMKSRIISYLNALGFYLKAFDLPDFPHFKKIDQLRTAICDMNIRTLDINYVESIEKNLSPEEKKLVYINIFHNNQNRHLDEEKELWEHVSSLPDFKELLMTNYADCLGIPKEFQFDVHKELTVDGQDVSVIAQGFFDYESYAHEATGTYYPMSSTGKYIVGEKDGKKYFIYDNGMSEHRFIGQKYGMDKVLGGGRATIDMNGIVVDRESESKVYGKDPYQESGFTQKVFENILKK